MYPHSSTMPRGKEISEDIRKKVRPAHQPGEIYKSICKRFQLHPSSVRQILYKWAAFDMTSTLPGSPSTPHHQEAPRSEAGGKSHMSLQPVSTGWVLQGGVQKCPHHRSARDWSEDDWLKKWLQKEVPQAINLNGLHTFAHFQFL